MSKIDILTVLYAATQSLERLDRIDYEKLESPHKEYYKALSDVRDKDISSFSELDLALVSELSIENKKVLSELFDVCRIIRLNEVDFEESLRDSGVGYKLFFEPILNSLIEMRRQVAAVKSAEFTIPGFPIPIVKGKLNSIIAPSHAGKTVYALGLAITLSRAGHKVVFISTEEDIAASIERTMEIDENDIAWTNLSMLYVGQFDKASLKGMILKASIEKVDFIVMDYIKKSMWDNYTSDHFVMEEINSTILKTLEACEHKISFFSFVQANRAGYGEKSELEEIQSDVSIVATFVDGGMPVYRSADNVLFLRPKDGQRRMLVAKARRNADLVGAIIGYDVNLDTYQIKVGSPQLFSYKNNKKENFESKNSIKSIKIIKNDI